MRERARGRSDHRANQSLSYSMTSSNHRPIQTNRVLFQRRLDPRPQLPSHQRRRRNPLFRLRRCPHLFPDRLPTPQENNRRIHCQRCDRGISWDYPRLRIRVGGTVPCDRGVDRGHLLFMDPFRPPSNVHRRRARYFWSPRNRGDHGSLPYRHFR